ncbi:hypothetical protein CK203_103113 [Vitis vinifera]|uniref:CAAX prenyl protease 2/Lysostaphin resistance protein A-like domain-containing protein n=1 Tax=Vitis vinifera TaxID=29760 RepID=A0A438DP70_VITVI|nr:hypothetical protein CK203_103113 [Vitis vinifera]
MQRARVFPSIAFLHLNPPSTDFGQSDAATMSAPCCRTLSHYPSLISPPISRIRISNLPRTSLSLNQRFRIVDTLSRQEESSAEIPEFETVEDKLPEELAKPEVEQSDKLKKDCVSKAADAFFGMKPWTVPWTAMTILQIRYNLWMGHMDYMSALAVAFAMKGVGDDDKYGSCVVWQCSGTVYLVPAAERCRSDGDDGMEVEGASVAVMLLWIASFWLVGSWIIPFLAHKAGFRKETMTHRGQALYGLLGEVTEGLSGIAILHICLARFHPLPSDWFRLSLEGKWHFDVGLGCLMFPLVNRLSQINENLLPVAPSTPVTGSSVQQSIVARDPLAMALYAVFLSVCAPIWEEIFFRGFLLPSLTRYMPVWCSILVSSVAFASAHLNLQTMLPFIFLGMLIGAVFARSRNLLASMLLHSLWNAFVFVDLMKYESMSHHSMEDTALVSLTRYSFVGMEVVGEGEGEGEGGGQLVSLKPEYSHRQGTILLSFIPSLLLD